MEHPQVKVNDRHVTYLGCISFSKYIQLSKDVTRQDVHSSQTIAIYALIFLDRCQDMYVCLTALLKVKAAIPHVKPRSNVGRSKAMVSVFPAQSEDMFGEDMSLITE